MARWEPNARLRLVQAAIDLFGEQGYDSTTVAQIAERAGLTKTTFFRHFPDKREVLFAGQEEHGRLLAEGAAAAPGTATPLETVAAALDALAASFTPEQRAFGPRLMQVIGSHCELRERAAFKSLNLTTTLATALHDRGVPDPAASLAAHLGAQAFSTAFARWITPANDHTLPDLTHQSLNELREATAALT
ncbi:helix-turn-helix domain-containing protein [Streptomyces hyaluromycini]|uniref:Helix-turn-helix domain-containing protein n=1 Tax=Streptomyces hyaluromycini TaxID=1377993 RepID=A0ABV1XFU2_9ACTN